MKRVLIDGDKHFYKACMHLHSTCSDGMLTPKQIKEEYKKRGYSVVAFTDHEHVIDHSDLNDNDFLTITSCEIAIKEFPDQSTLKNYNMRVAHLNFYAIEPHNTVTPCYNSQYDHFIKDEYSEFINYTCEYDRVYTADGVNDIIAKATEMGFMVAYNHPTWSLENACDYLNYDGLFAVEIYNHGVFCENGVSDEHVLDDFMRAGKPVFCTCTDDAHKILPADANTDAFGGWIMIASHELSYKNIIHSLRVGDFYASCGPVIKSLVIENDVAKVEFSDCVAANLITLGRRAEAVRSSKGEFINRAEFALLQSDGYFRITVTDASGKKAYTQYYEV